jgi:hypothetical protein
MQLPVAVTRAGSQPLSESGVTRNISSGGVLFTAHHEMDVGGAIEYAITLISQQEPHVVLRCIGKVLRYEKVPSREPAHEAFAVAATLERYEFIRPER